MPHFLQMRRIHATAIPAEMIELRTNCPVLKLEGKAMSPDFY